MVAREVGSGLTNWLDEPQSDVVFVIAGDSRRASSFRIDVVRKLEAHACPDYPASPSMTSITPSSASADDGIRTI